MKHILILLLLLAGILVIMPMNACKKSVQNLKEDYVLGVMTQGRWYLENYTEYGVDKTSDFQAYEFQFYKDYRLDAISSSGVTTGTWAGDVNSITLTVNLGSTSDVLKRLNHVWKFIRSNIGLAFAETTTPNGLISIRLKRK
jgi:hypothetical protein